MKNKVYIFRGGPVSGKSTVISVFCKLLPEPVAMVSQDKFRSTVAQLEQYLKEGANNIIVEGRFTWDDRSSTLGSSIELIELVKKYGYEVKPFVLSADKVTLLGRNAAGKNGLPSDEFAALANTIYNKIDSAEILIESTDLSVQETVDLVAKHI